MDDFYKHHDDNSNTLFLFKTEEGYVYGGWCLSSLCESVVDFMEPIASMFKLGSQKDQQHITIYNVNNGSPITRKWADDKFLRFANCEFEISRDKLRGYCYRDTVSADICEIASLPPRFNCIGFELYKLVKKQPYFIGG